MEDFQRCPQSPVKEKEKGQHCHTLFTIFLNNKGWIVVQLLLWRTITGKLWLCLYRVITQHEHWWEVLLHCSFRCPLQMKIYREFSVHSVHKCSGLFLILEECYLCKLISFLEIYFLSLPLLFMIAAVPSHLWVYEQGAACKEWR